MIAAPPMWPEPGARIVAHSIVRSEAVGDTKAIADGCELSARCGSGVDVAGMLVPVKQQDATCAVCVVVGVETD